MSNHPRFSGELITTPWGSDKKIIQGTTSCEHCQYTRVYQPGSGYNWYKCGGCGGVLCERCAKQVRNCVPIEQMLENIENGRPLDYRPIFSAGGF